VARENLDGVAPSRKSTSVILVFEHTSQELFENTESYIYNTYDILGTYICPVAIVG
jgi:hypothetical protein